MNESVHKQIVGVATNYAATMTSARQRIAEADRRRFGRVIAPAPPTNEMKPHEVYDSALRGMALAELRRQNVGIVRDGTQFVVDPAAIALFAETYAKSIPGLVIVPDEEVAEAQAIREAFRQKVTRSVERTRRNLERVDGYYERMAVRDERMQRRLLIESQIEGRRASRVRRSLRRTAQPIVMSVVERPVELDVTDQMSFLQTLGIFETARTTKPDPLVPEVSLTRKRRYRVGPTPRVIRDLDIDDAQQIAMNF